MVVVNEAQNLVYVTAGGNLLAVIDGANDSPLALLTMPASVTNNQFERRIAIHDTTGRVYLRSAEFPAPSRLIIVDGKRTSPTFNTIVAQLALGREDGSGDIAVDQTGNRVVVTSNIDFRTTVIDALSDTVVNTIPAVMTRFRIGINPLNHRAFVTGGIGFIQAIDLASRRAPGDDRHRRRGAVPALRPDDARRLRARDDDVEHRREVRRFGMRWAPSPACRTAPAATSSSRATRRPTVST